jgi:hypothetical protein
MYNEHITIRNITSNTQYMETQMGENHIMLSYIYIENSFIENIKFQILWLQLEGGSIPLFIGSNLKEATTL